MHILEWRKEWQKESLSYDTGKLLNIFFWEKRRKSCYFGIPQV